MRGEKLSARDAVGQMFVVAMSGTEHDYYIEMVRERNIGGVVLFGYNMESEDRTKQLMDSLQQLSMNTEPVIPLFIARDHEVREVQSPPWVPAQPRRRRLIVGRIRRRRAGSRKR